MAKPARPATTADQSAVAAFLRQHLPLAFYPLTNLTYYGLCTDHPRSLQGWLWWEDDQLTDVLIMTKRGFLYPVFTTDVAPQAADLLVGLSVVGLSGAPDQIIELKAEFGITATPARDFTEPVYHLNLDRLNMPDTLGLVLRPLTAVSMRLLTEWRTAFLMETQGTVAEVAVHRALNELDEIIKRGTYRVLMNGPQPVAMTGFNAVFGDVVQVGGVFTPPGLRGRGYGRIAVALHLQQAHAKGVSQAYLSAATAPAARAYESLGFARNGCYRAVIYEKEQCISG